MHEMGWPQPPTPIQVDNSTACGIANNTCKKICSKAMDMRFYWVCDRVQQGQFDVYWAPGCDNLADYFTKKHSPIHHKQMRPIYLHTMPSSSLRGCVDSLTPSGTHRLVRPSSAVRQHTTRQGHSHTERMTLRA